jgi:flagellar basal body-associated protein FliL
MESEKERKDESGSARPDTGEANSDDRKRSKTELDTEGLEIEGATSTAAATAGEETESTGEQKEVPKKVIGARKHLLMGISLLLVLVLVGGGVFMWVKYFSSGRGAEGTGDHPKGPLYELKPFFIPLNTNAEDKQFIRLTMTLELHSEGTLKQVKKHLEEIRGTIFPLLLNTSVERFEWEREPLAQELTSAINHSLGETHIKRVFFKSIIEM